MSKLSIHVGDYVHGFAPTPGDRVVFIAQDGRAAFEVVAADNGSLEIRAVDYNIHDGERREARLTLLPIVTNVVNVYAQKAKDQASTESEAA